MFEHHRHPLLPRRHYYLRLARVGCVAAGIMLVALLLGAVGYRVTEHWGWLDCVHNAAMILTGMGPVIPVKSDAGKIFATCYALFSGVIFLTIAAVLLSPVAHRMIHRFHLELDDSDGGDKGRHAPISRSHHNP